MNRQEALKYLYFFFPLSLCLLRPRIIIWLRWFQKKGGSSGVRLYFILYVWFDLILSAETVRILQMPVKAGMSNLYSLGILIQLLHRRHQILLLPAIVFSLRDNDQLEVALRLFNVGPFAMQLSFHLWQSHELLASCQLQQPTSLPVYLQGIGRQVNLGDVWCHWVRKNTIAVPELGKIISQKAEGDMRFLHLGFGYTPHFSPFWKSG